MNVPLWSCRISICAAGHRVDESVAITRSQPNIFTYIYFWFMLGLFPAENVKAAIVLQRVSVLKNAHAHFHVAYPQYVRGITSTWEPFLSLLLFSSLLIQASASHHLPCLCSTPKANISNPNECKCWLNAIGISTLLKMNSTLDYMKYCGLTTCNIVKPKDSEPTFGERNLHKKCIFCACAKVKKDLELCIK